MQKMVVLSVALVMAVFAAASCSSGETSSTTSSTTQTPLSTTTPAGAITTSTVSSTHCSTEQLRGSLGQAQFGAGQRYLALILTNTGTKTCDMRGFPGVSLLDAGAKQLGQPALREGAEGVVVSIAPGQSASFTLHTSAEGMGAACEPASTQIKVFPPDNTTPLFIQTAYSACGGFRVTTLVAGSDGY